MDAKKLSEALNATPLAPPATGLPVSCSEPCNPSNCRFGCALEVTDELLADPAISGEQADHLLDFRRLLQSRRDAEAALQLFCQLRGKLETKYYLAFYRLRRWLENQIVAEVRSSPEAAPVRVRLRVDLYCSQSIRRLCLCELLKQGGSLNQPHISLLFRPLPAKAAAPHSSKL